ncbi:E3 ubiquitin-protein ligase RBBP6 [Carex littledalei]|uniref:E3 ubiquitin-protein ligase RBBP6 n=1 Tax=Carex littledalei TaxID=544730 RepID=A0A833VHN4_9POAL|nr:E3 ubiquitin-protein ligase RBBP6 [Carex littledalei]
MSVYFKFKSAKEFNSLPIEGQFISIGNLKERIFELKHLGRGNDFDIVVSNAQTNEEYLDEAALIPRNTSVLIRRVPGRPRMRMVANLEEVKAIEDSTQNITPDTSNVAAQHTTINPEESEWDEFGNDPYAIVAEGQLAQSFNPANVSSSDKLDEDSKLRALLETPSLDWSSQNDGPRGRGYGRGIGGRMMGGRGFGRGLFENRNPPPGYVCHRCNITGHFIQHCPTNGNPAYDPKRFKPPTGIPKSMLMTTPDGSYSLPGGAVAVLQPNEAAFEREIEGIPTLARAATVSTDLLPENLRCPLCKEIMKDAVLTSKCCFNSFCDKCIRDRIINESKCACGSRDVLADDLLPNKTLRETINQMLESAATSSQEKAGSHVQAQDMQSSVPVQEKVPSPAVSGLRVDTKGPAPVKEFSLEGANGVKALVASDATPESATNKDPRSPEKSPLMKDNAEKPPIGDQAKKKKKKKQRPTEELGGFNGYMQMPGPSFNPCFGNAMPHMPMDPFMGTAPYGGPMHPFMGLPPAPYGGGFPPVPDPFMAQHYMNMMPPAPRDLAELALGNVGMNRGPPPMMHRGEDFEGRRVDFRRRRDMEGPPERFERERRDPRDWDARRERREGSSARDVSSIPKHKPSTSSQGASRPERPERPERSERSVRPDRRSTQEREHRAKSHDSPPHQSPRRSKKRSSHQEADEAAPTADLPAAEDLPPPSKKMKGSVFSRICFPEGGSTSKKAKISESEVVPPPPPPRSSSRVKEDRYDPATSKDSRLRSKRSYDDEDDESSDEDRHFKRRSRRKEDYEDVPEEEHRHSRRSKEHDRTHYHRSSSRQRD